MIIPTEPICSIPRPPVLVTAASQDSADEKQLEVSYIAALRDTVECFEATGSSVITDSEQRKHPNFFSYCLHGSPNTAPDGFQISFAAGHTRRVPRLTGSPFRYQRYADEFISQAQRYANKPVKQSVISPSALSRLYPPDGLPGFDHARYGLCQDSRTGRRHGHGRRHIARTMKDSR